MMIRNTGITRLLLLGSVMFSALASAQTVDEIMAKVDHEMRRSYGTQIAKIKMTTCNYKLKKGKIRCTSKPRKVLIQNTKKIATVDNVHARSLAIILEPVTDKGIGLLTFEYDERGRDNDNWLYLSALGKANRIVANAEESGSVFGSEFSIENTENPEARKIYEYSYKIIDEQTYHKRPVWVIEMTPTAEKAKRTRYEKLVAWIDKEKFFALKENYYRNGKIHKQRTQKKVVKIDGVWIATKVTMNNLTTSRLSQMNKTSVAHNMTISDEFLTQRALTDFAFRERNLKQFRDYFQTRKNGESKGL